jgi:hypothetical protein
MAKQSILVARHQLSYRIEGKRATVAPGTELTAALLKKMKLDKDEVEKLKTTGAVAEQNVHVSDADGGDVLEALREQVQKAEAKAAAETRRAEAAEARVAELDARVAELEAAAASKGEKKA